jgi:hypothetical protein
MTQDYLRGVKYKKDLKKALLLRTHMESGGAKLSLNVKKSDQIIVLKFGGNVNSLYDTQACVYMSTH